MAETSEIDRQDFEKRLSKYGLDTSTILAQDLTTARSSITQLYTSTQVQSAFRPVILKTGDFDTVKKWIGVPNALVEKGYSVEAPRKVRLPEMELKRSTKAARAQKAEQEYNRESLTSENLTHIRDVARAYLRGDSRKLSEYKGWIKSIFPIVSVSFWPFFNITVKSGSVLEFGPGPNVLIACSITIEEGGLVRSYGDLKVDATILRKEEPPLIYKLDPSLVRANNYLNLLQKRRSKCCS